MWDIMVFSVSAELCGLSGPHQYVRMFLSPQKKLGAHQPSPPPVPSSLSGPHCCSCLHVCQFCVLHEQYYRVQRSGIGPSSERTGGADGRGRRVHPLTARGWGGVEEGLGHSGGRLGLSVSPWVLSRDPFPSHSQTLLRAAHEVELQRQKEAEKLERRLALPASEQPATQVSPHLPAPPCPCLPCAPHPAPDTPLPPHPRSLRSRSCARGCWRSQTGRRSRARARTGGLRLEGSRLKEWRPPRHPCSWLQQRRRPSNSGGGRRLRGRW